MEAVKFLKLYRRYCKTKTTCHKNCPLYDTGACIRHKVLSALTGKDIEILLTVLEEFEKSHPIKTLLQDFFEKYPNAPKDEDGTPLNLCPSDLGYCDDEEDCNECWDQEVGEE